MMFLSHTNLLLNSASHLNLIIVIVRFLIVWTFVLAALLGQPMRLMATSLPCAETSTVVPEIYDCCNPSKPTSCCCHLDAGKAAETPLPTAPAPSFEPELPAPQRLELGGVFAIVPSARTLGTFVFSRHFPDKLNSASAPRTVLLCTFLI